MGLDIVNVSSYVGEKKISNSYFEDYLDTNDQWIRKRTGIENRCFTDLTCSEMCIKALEKINLDSYKDDIKMLITASISSETIMPSISATLHQYIGLNENVITFDMNMACSGLTASLQLAEKYLEEGDYAICVGVEKLSSIVDFEDRTTCILFGDGASILLVRKNKKKAVFSFGTDMSNDLFLASSGKIKMNGKAVFKFATRVLPKAILDLIDNSDLTIEEVDHIVLHQANKRIIDYVAKSTGYEEKYFANIENFGNTSSASVGICLDDMKKRGLVKNGDSLLLMAFGGGLTYSGLIVDWRKNEIK